MGFGCAQLRLTLAKNEDGREKRSRQEPTLLRASLFSANLSQMTLSRSLIILFKTFTWWRGLFLTMTKKKKYHICLSTSPNSIPMRHTLRLLIFPPSGEWVFPILDERDIHVLYASLGQNAVSSSCATLPFLNPWIYIHTFLLLFTDSTLSPLERVSASSRSLRGKKRLFD